MALKKKTGAAKKPLGVLGTLKGLRKDLRTLAKKPNDGTRLGDMIRRGSASRVRKGEDPMTSRGYSFMNLLGLVANKKSGGHCGLSEDKCKVEIGVHNRLNKSYKDRNGWTKAEANSILAPVGAELIGYDTEDEDLANECRTLVKMGASGRSDPEELLYAARKTGNKEFIRKALSWVDESLGGAFVAPPMQGELIEILRNNEAFMAAGARVIGMPPMGRITYPRQTGVASANWVGESQSIPDSQQQTGDLTLQAHKLGVLVKIPNELFRFSSVSIEQFVRDDIARVMALLLDKYLLEGGTATAPTSGNAPRGIITYPNINLLSAFVTGANGDTFSPEDIARFVQSVEEKNAEFKAFIMRPVMYAALVNRRADAAVAGDKAGGFMFNWVRDIQSSNFNIARGKVGNIYGYDVVKTTQVANNRTKGTASNLSYVLGGDFTDYILAMGGVIEFLISTQGDTAVAADQTWVRGIQYVDGGPRHEASFTLMDTLQMA